jgi:N utilization substance protein A
LEALQEIAQPIHRSSHQLLQAVAGTLEQLDEVADRINAGFITDLFHAVIPECAANRVRVVAVARSVGYRTKVMILASVEGINAVALCIGRQGTRIQQIRDALGNEKVDLIDGQVEPEMQVLQALGILKPEHVSVTLDRRADKLTAYVRFDTPLHAQAVTGPHGANVRLANQVTGINILVLE